MDLTIVMSTCNRAIDTQRFLESLETTQCRPEVKWEVIVVDNNSTDQTSAVVSEYIQRAGYPLKLLLEARKGKSAGVNAGISAARGKIIALTDDDIIVTQDWVQGIIDYFQQNELAGCIGGMVQLFNPADAPITIKTDPTPAIVEHANFTPHNTPVFGCNAAIRRTVLDETGLFDLELGPGTPMRAAEDIDLVYRIAKAGFQIHYVPSIMVFHNHGRRTQEQVRRIRRDYGYGMGALYAKYFKLFDRQIMRCAYWDIRDTLRRNILRCMFDKESREQMRNVYYNLIGILLYLRHHKESPT